MEPITDNSEAFDAAFGLYTWLSYNHEGQTSDKYAALSKLVGEYKLNNVPDIEVDSTDQDENEMARFIYHDLTEDNWSDYFETFCNFMDNEWESEE